MAKDILSGRVSKWVVRKVRGYVKIRSFQNHFLYFIIGKINKIPEEIMNKLRNLRTASSANIDPGCNLPATCLKG